MLKYNKAQRITGTSEGKGSTEISFDSNKPPPYLILSSYARIHSKLRRVTSTVKLWFCKMKGLMAILA